MALPQINVGGITGTQAMILTAQQADSIIKPLGEFAKGLSKLSGSFARASIAPLKSAASFAGRSALSTGGIVKQRISQAGFDREGITSTLFEDNPIMNALSGMIGDMSSKITGVGKKFLFGSGENRKLPSAEGLSPSGASADDKNVEKIKEDVGVLRKLSEEEKKREKAEDKADKTAQGIARFKSEELASEMANMKKYYEGLTGKKGDSGKAGAEPKLGLMDTLSGAFAAGGMMMLGKMLVGFLFGKEGILRRGLKFAFKKAGGLVLKGLKGSGKLLAKGFTTVGGRLLGGIVALAIDGLLGYFESDEWGVTKGAGAIGGMLGGTFENRALNMFANAGKWALIGATIGSFVPVIGTAIGGAVGALLGAVLGYFGGERIAKATDELGKSIEESWEAFKDGWVNIMDSIVLWIQENAPPIAAMLGLKTSKQKAAHAITLQDEQERRAAHQEYLEGRPFKTLPGGGQMALTDEEIARTEADRAWLSSPEAVEIATSGPEGAAAYVRMVNQVNSGISLDPLKNNLPQVAPVPKDLRVNFAAGLEQAGAAAAAGPPIMIAPVSSPTNIVNGGGGGGVVINGDAASLDQGVSAP